jgi:hypothetical protein
MSIGATPRNKLKITNTLKGVPSRAARGTSGSNGYSGVITGLFSGEMEGSAEVWIPVRTTCVALSELARQNHAAAGADA